jgi:hypothetical protein
VFIRCRVDRYTNRAGDGERWSKPRGHVFDVGRLGVGDALGAAGAPVARR